MSLCLDVSGVPVPGRPPGHQHGSGTWPAAAGQCSKQCVHGLPTPRAGSEFEDDLRARGADFKSSGTSDHVPGLGSQTLAQPGNDMSTAELLLAAELLSAMLKALRVQAVPPTAGSCSHRVAEKLYASKEDPRTSA